MSTAIKFSAAFHWVLVQVLEPQNIMGEFGVLLVHPENNFSYSIIYLSLFSFFFFLNIFSDYIANGKKLNILQEMTLE